jgi:hypothetical protein
MPLIETEKCGVIKLSLDNENNNKFHQEVEHRVHCVNHMTGIIYSMSTMPGKVDWEEDADEVEQHCVYVESPGDPIHACF